MKSVFNPSTDTHLVEATVAAIQKALTDCGIAYLVIDGNAEEPEWDCGEDGEIDKDLIADLLSKIMVKTD